MVFPENVVSVGLPEGNEDGSPILFDFHDTYVIHPLVWVKDQ